MSNRSTRWLAILVAFAFIFPLAACAPAAAVETPAAGEEVEAPATGAAQPVQLTGEIEVSNALIIEVYFNQRFVYLQDLSGFAARDYEYTQPVEAEILGPVSVNEDEGTFSYLLNLPARPISPTVDGVMVWQVVMDANLIDDPFLGEDETGGWSANYTSAKIDAENKNEIVGGKLVVYAPEADLEFSSGFGDDGLLLTDDDPTMTLPQGYSVVDLDSDPFAVIVEEVPELYLYEGDIQVTDLSAMTWTEAFDALFNKASAEYPFTEMKGLDWQAIYDDIAPRIAEAEANEDGQAYYLALRDFSWMIPDGHVGVSGYDYDLFYEDITGSYGFTLAKLTDGRIVANLVLPDSPAAAAGMAFGSEIVSWNGMPAAEAVDAVVPWSSPFSNPESRLVQQLRYITRAKLDTEAEVTFVAADGTEKTVTLVAYDDSFATFSATSVFKGFDDFALPIEYRTLDNGYGYIKINSLSDDLNFTIRIWEWAIENFIEQEVPGIIIDMRQNSGGAPFGTYLAGAFYEGERWDVSRSYYFSEESGDFETFGPADYIEPDDELYYGGPLAVLVSTGCSSACEDVAYTLGLLDQTTIVGYTSSDGIFGEVGRGMYTLPGTEDYGTYYFQIPTGMSLDMDGTVIIEGPGVVPDFRVPVTLDILAAENEGRDVVLDAAVAQLSGDTFDLIPLSEEEQAALDAREGKPVFNTDKSFMAALQAGLPYLEDNAEESYPADVYFTPGELVYTIALPDSEDMIWAAGWCAVDEATLDDNWANMAFTFTFNGEDVADLMGEWEGDGGDTYCRFKYAILEDWFDGEYTLVATHNFLSALNDGFDDYEAGARVSTYNVTIG